MDTSRPSPVHEQTVDGFGTVSLHPVDPSRDIDLIYDWVTQPRAHFWGMRDLSRAQIHRIYTHLDAHPTHQAHLVSRNATPVALFHTYDPADDRIGRCYPVRAGDTGIHLLIGPTPTATEPGFTGSVFPVLLTYALSTPHRHRIVGEPDARNDKVLTRLSRTGFTLGPEIHLPETTDPDFPQPRKTARLVFYP